MKKELKSVIKNYNKLSEEDLNEFMEYLKEDDKVELKEETKVEEVKKEVIEEEPKKEFVTEDKLKSILADILGKVALKEEIEEIKVDKKKATKFGADGKTIVSEVDDRDSRLATILSQING